VHTKVLAVVVADVASAGEVPFERLTFGTAPEQWKVRAEWCVEYGVQEVVMEATAQYGKPVWEALERYWQPSFGPPPLPPP
jgi:hypothetical protein